MEEFNNIFFAKLFSGAESEDIFNNTYSLEFLIEELKLHAKEVGPYDFVADALLALECAGNRGENVKTKVAGKEIFSFQSRDAMYKTMFGKDGLDSETEKTSNKKEKDDQALLKDEEMSQRGE